MCYISVLACCTIIVMYYTNDFLCVLRNLDLTLLVVEWTWEVLGRTGLYRDGLLCFRVQLNARSDFLIHDTLAKP